MDDGLFYVIDYDASKIEGVGKFVTQSQKIEPPKKDEIRDTFHAMRDIARANRTMYFNNNRFFDQRIKKENANIFYKQGMFMKDFTDHYHEKVPFKEYFPHYQIMSYEQLRTYFTWRTEVRKGNISDISLSYVYLYIYELLNNIGVADPQDGLHKLMILWSAFRVNEKSLDKYIFKWLKDYHIYYQMSQSFIDFIEQNNLTNQYPNIGNNNNNFDLFCAISKYDIKSSAFFTDDKIKLITDCFCFVTDTLRHVCFENGIEFDEFIFQPTKKMSPWLPFKNALFFNWMKQPDKRIVLSEKEIYICKQNNWAFNTTITAESDRKLIGYIMKQMESVLRIVTKYKYKLTANINTVTHELVGTLHGLGLSLDKIVTDAVMEFYREATKTVVSVEHDSLCRIRQEALSTQERLVVEETTESLIPNIAPTLSLLSTKDFSDSSMTDKFETTSIAASDAVSTNDIWINLKNTFSETELQAISIVLFQEKDIKKFADDNNVMLEVLMDGINEKAMDVIGDNLLDDEFTIYEDYINQVKEW